MLIVDANALFIAYDDNDPQQEKIVEALRNEKSARLVSPFVLAEADHLISQRLGLQTEEALLSDIDDGVYTLCTFNRDDLATARTVLAQYRDLRLGVADASNIVLAARYNTTQILTLNERHFRAVSPLTPEKDAFTILPADH